MRIYTFDLPNRNTELKYFVKHVEHQKMSVHQITQEEVNTIYVSPLLYFDLLNADVPILNKPGVPEFILGLEILIDTMLTQRQYSICEFKLYKIHG